MAEISLDRFQLQFISHQNQRMSYLDGIREALAGGCKWIQLRMKGATDESQGMVQRAECNLPHR